jgi:hypothetical protein
MRVESDVMIIERVGSGASERFEIIHNNRPAMKLGISVDGGLEESILVSLEREDFLAFKEIINKIEL